MIKRDAEICPQCGSLFTDCEEREILFGLDNNQEPHLYLLEKRTCTECHEQFTDSFILEYDGYFIDEDEYDRDGIKITKN